MWVPEMGRGDAEAAGRTKNIHSKVREMNTKLLLLHFDGRRSRCVFGFVGRVLLFGLMNEALLCW